MTLYHWLFSFRKGDGNFFLNPTGNKTKANENLFMTTLPSKIQNISPEKWTVHQIWRGAAAPQPHNPTAPLLVRLCPKPQNNLFEFKSFKYQILMIILLRVLYSVHAFAFCGRTVISVCIQNAVIGNCCPSHKKQQKYVAVMKTQLRSIKRTYLLFFVCRLLLLRILEKIIELLGIFVKKIFFK